MKISLEFNNNTVLLKSQKKNIEAKHDYENKNEPTLADHDTVFHDSINSELTSSDVTELNNDSRKELNATTEVPTDPPRRSKASKRDLSDGSSSSQKPEAKKLNDGHDEELRI